MKKSILNLGKILNKAEQKQINGGMGLVLVSCHNLFLCQYDCSEGEVCAIPGRPGNHIFGTIQNGLCCI